MWRLIFTERLDGNVGSLFLFAKFTKTIMRERYSELRSESGRWQRENGKPDLLFFFLNYWIAKGGLIFYEQKRTTG